MKRSFSGGIHPPTSKDLTKDKPIKILGAPPKVVIPLKQHIGAVCDPVVQIGERVKKGQLIGESAAFVSAPVHSSVSGIVSDICLYDHPSGVKTPAIIIENDGLDEYDESIKPYGDYNKLTKEEIVAAMKKAGMVGMGGATFPTHVKFSPPPDKKIDTLIINGAECEPYLTSDHREMLEKPRGVIDGVRIMLKVLELPKGYIAVEDNKTDAANALKNAAGKDPSIEIVVLKTKYPQGSEKQLIKVITGREVPSGKLPADVGTLVSNIDTCIAMSEVMARGVPLIRRVITVSGSGVNNPGNFSVAIGTSFREVFEAAGGLKEDVKKVIMGGPMMGQAQYSLDAPVIKGTSGLIALKEKDVQLYNEMPCVRCGKCSRGCPMKISPIYLALYSRNLNFEQMERYHITDCIECGSCSFVCPSKRNPVQYIRVGKALLAAEKSKGKEKK